MSEMHEDFATWYSRVDLGDDTQRLEARWSGVEAMIDAVDYEGCGGLIDLFLGRSGSAMELAGEFVREHQNTSDPNFASSGNDLELKLLAEICLALKITTNGDQELAGQIASLIFTAVGGGVVEHDTATGLTQRAKEVMRVQGHAIRKRVSLPPPPKSYVPKIDFNDCIEDGGNMSSAPPARQVMEKMATKIGSAIGRMAAQAHKERSTLENQLKVQDEELDLLWWASNGVTTEDGVTISTLAEGKRGLIAAVDAAQLTQFEPGPAGVVGLLEKVGVSANKKVSISDAVNASDEAWLRSITVEDVGPRTPVHFAIAKRLETPDANAWVAHWASICGIDSEKKISEIELSHLFYRERLALDQFGEE